MAKPVGTLVRFPVVDALGQETRKAPSQKAVTDALNGKLSKTEAYNKSEVDVKVADAKKAGTDANNNANTRVPNTRKVNNKALSADIVLTPADIGVYTKSEVDTKVNAAAGTANNAVPNTRRVNGKQLNVDITLNSNDIFNQITDLGSTNLNSVTNPGLYGQRASVNATTASNYPTALAGTLEVFKNLANGDGLLQRYTTFDNAQCWTRIFTNKAWSGWVRYYSTNYKPSAADVGVYTKGEVDTRVNTANVAASNAQATANKAVTDASNANTNANNRVAKSDILQAVGQSTTQVMSQKAITDQLNQRLLTGKVVQVTGQATDTVMSQKAVTDQLNTKAATTYGYSKAESDTRIADAKKAGTDANNNANGRVPTSRKVNGKPLTGDITLGAGDVGAYSKTETDSKLTEISNKVMKPYTRLVEIQTGNMGNGSSVTVKYDLRGRLIFVKWDGSLTTECFMPPIDGLPMNFSRGQNAFASFKTTNNGTTLTKVGGYYGDHERIYMAE